MNPYLLAGALLAGLAVGWSANGVRYDLRIADAELVRIADEKAAADQQALAIWVADQNAQEGLTNAENKAAAFERCIDAGAGCGLRVKVRTVAAVCPGQVAGLGAGVEQTAELDPASRQDYRALRDGIIRLESALKVCVSTTKE